MPRTPEAHRAADLRYALAEARRYADDPKYSLAAVRKWYDIAGRDLAKLEAHAVLAALCEEYEAWLTANGYPNAGSADELRAGWAGKHGEVELTPAQVTWLDDFIERWERWEEQDRAAHRG